MIKLAKITPINCIKHEQDGPEFAVYWNQGDGTLRAVFEDGSEEILEESADMLEDAIDIVYSMFAISIAYIYEPEEVEYEA